MGVNLGTHLRILKKYLWVLILIPTLSAITTFAYVKYFATPEYKATTILIIGKKYTEEKSLTNNDILVSTQLINTCSQIVRQIITEDLIKTYNLETIKNKIEINQISNTQLIEIKVSDSNPQKAADMTNYLANATIDEISQIIPSHFITVLDTAKVPKSPYKPKLQIYIFASVSIGLMLALGIITLLTLLNNKLFSSEDISNYLDLPTLGIIPTLKE